MQKKSLILDDLAFNMFLKISRESFLTLLVLLFQSNFVLLLENKNDIGAWWTKVSTGYPKYAETTNLIKKMVRFNREFVNYYSAGKTVSGREMWVIQLSENVQKPRALLKPMVKQVSSMHGDEVVGRALLLMLAVDIIKRYSEGDPRIRKLLRTVDIHLMPSVNPDGFEEAEQTCNPNPSVTGRRNKNVVDLNRDFPDQFIMKRGDPMFWKNRQPETINMMRYITNYPFVLSTNLHGGDVVASYPFDSVPLDVDHEKSYKQTGVPSLAPDDKVFQFLALEYSKHHKTMFTQNKQGDDGSDDCISDGFTDGVTNGADWYNVRGGMQDFNYVHSNCFEITIELSCCKYPPDSKLIEEWENNKESLYNFMENVHMGASGIVKNNYGQPIKGARIIIKEIKKTIQTTSRGEYWRLLTPGTYNIKVVALGHKATAFKKLVIAEGVNTRLDFTLEQL